MSRSRRSRVTRGTRLSGGVAPMIKTSRVYAGGDRAHEQRASACSGQIVDGRDFVLGHRGRDHFGLLLFAGAVAAKGLNRRCRFPALENVDTTRGDEVGGKREVQAAGRVARLLDDLNAALQVRLTLFGL